MDTETMTSFSFFATVRPMRRDFSCMVQKPIARLSYPGLASYGLDESLTFLFPQRAILQIGPEHLNKMDLRNFSLLVLPGSIGEDSPYPQIFDHLKVRHIEETVKEKGLNVLTLCAATYYLFDHISFRCRDGRLKQIKGIGIVKGRADGPAYRSIIHARDHKEPDRDIVLAQLRLNHSHWHTHSRIVDINGPALHISPAESLTKTFLRYADIGGQPAAGFVKKIGKGTLTALSVHPEIPLTHPLFNNRFDPLEDQRLDFLKMLRHTFG